MFVERSEKQLGFSTQEQKESRKRKNDHRNKINIKLLLSFQLKYDVITQLNTKFSTFWKTYFPFPKGFLLQFPYLCENENNTKLCRIANLRN